MNRLIKHRGEARCMGTYMKATAVAVAMLGEIWVGTAHAQVGVESAILNNNAAAPTKPMHMSASGPIQVTIGSPATAEANRESAARGPNCTGAMREHSEVTVPIGKSTMVQLPEPVRNRTVGNPRIVQAMLVSPQTLYVLGLDVGSTNMIVQGRSGSCTVIDVSVGADPAGLQAALRRLVPGAKNVEVSAAADSIVLGGTVSDSVQAQKIVDIANAFVTRQARSPVRDDQGAAGQQTAGQMNAGGQNGGPLRSPRIINMMAVEAPQQVMLEVKVAEVSKTLIDQMGSALNVNGAFGSWTVGALANFLSGSNDIVNFSKNNHLPLKFSLDAQKGDGLVKVLAEPSLMAISGQEASFLAGGKVFIPVAQGSPVGGVATVILQEETFGVGLRFTPTVMENGRINLKVSPEVSELSPTGVAVTAPNSNNTSILPLITTRRASTTLQVHDGQSFAIGGLIKNNITGSLNAIPGVGELPVIGALARSTSFQRDQTELVFVVTPHLVKPLPANYPLPTDSFGSTNTGEILMNGNMEGHPAAPAKAPAATAAPTSALPAPKAPQVMDAAATPVPVQTPAPTAAAPAAPATPAAPAAKEAQAPAAVAAPPAPADSDTPAAPTAAAPAPDTRRFVSMGEQPFHD
ncbi:type II and III secretion system protein family protein [Ralstonia sp. ASV6]|uniref:type II and III secretion system protein family protein n=1 Tax=Ralstonia sp. ASV6 TaxID=2795124 RepID=UPI0018EA39C9|nr:type II and III secretion system protein family protein [Ralstonia sp. ASV6]